MRPVRRTYASRWTILPVSTPDRREGSPLRLRRLYAPLACLLIATLAGCGSAPPVRHAAAAAGHAASVNVPAPSVQLAGLTEPAGTIPGIFAEAGANAPKEPTPSADLAPQAAAAVLMDAASGQVLWAKNANARRPAASVTKLMTMALVLDAVSSGRIRWNDLVSASQQAVQTGGAQIWLELGENMTVQQLFYAVAVQSANDAAVALGEYVGGTMNHFVAMMNAKAQALGMRDTLYTDTNGLDDTAQYTSAYDIALLSRYLVTAHPEVLKYTSTWEHRLRGNKLWLVNRNKLLTRLPGVDGLKTGFTTKAGYCLSATARRGSTRLIAVVLGDPTGAARFHDAAAQLQWGFSHYSTVPVAQAGQPVAELPVDGGHVRSVRIVPSESFGVTVPRGQEKGVTTKVQLPKLLSAPLGARQRVGEITAFVDGRSVAQVPLLTAGAVRRVGGLRLWMRLWAGLWPWLR